MIWKKIVGILSLVVIATVVGRSLLVSPARTSAVQDQPALIQQPTARVATEVQVVKAATCAATPAPALAAVGSQEPDGKQVLAVSDGKTVLPTDGKETLPPVGELVGQRTNSVDPGHTGPPTEYLNKETSNPLLTPPNPVNISGPVVSPETKSPL